jgi:hypothetical protein
VLFYVLFVYKYVLYYCHRVTTQLQLTNISYPISYLHAPIVMKSGSLILLEPSGPLQACNGITLPLPLLKQCMPPLKIVSIEVPINVAVRIK